MYVILTIHHTMYVTLYRKHSCESIHVDEVDCNNKDTLSIRGSRIRGQTSRSLSVHYPQFATFPALTPNPPSLHPWPHVACACMTGSPTMFSIFSVYYWCKCAQGTSECMMRSSITCPLNAMPSPLRPFIVTQAHRTRSRQWHATCLQWHVLLYFTFV